MKILTIKDIAALSGVGVSTVSRVLNEHPDVADETREKVLDVVARYHYRPNSNARNLKQTSADLISIIVRGRENTFLMDIAERIIEIGSKEKQKFLMASIDETDDELEAAYLHVAEKKVKGIIFLGANVAAREKEIKKFPLPCVFATVDTSAQGFSGVSSVSIDNYTSGGMAIEYLLDQGHKRIAIFGGGQSINDGIGRRYQGALHSFAKRRISFDPSLSVQCSFSMEKAYQAAMRFLQEKPSFTAVFAMSDMMAIGIIRALHECKLHVPEDVSVIGFDGTALSRFVIPSLVTIAQPAHQIAQQSVSLIMRLIKDPEDSENILVKSILQEGESVKPR